MAAVRVDRGQDLAVIREMLTRPPGVVCVEGKVGIGKSAVLSETIRMAKNLGFRVLAAQASPSETGFRFGVATQLFESETDRILDRRELSEQAVLHGLYRVARTIAGDGPVLIAVDDLEQADPESVRFLAYLQRRLGELPVLLAVTRGFASRGPEPGLLNEVVGNATRVRLAALDPRACARMGVSAEEVIATGANPYLMALCRREPAERARELAARLEQAGWQVLALARALAVLGEADLALAAEAADLDPPAAVAAARTLAGMGFTTSHGFTYPMVRATLLGSMTVLDRNEINARAAWFRYENQAPLEEIADQLLDASSIGLEWARDVLLGAARKAAPEKAIAYLHRLLREPLPDDLRGEVLVELGQAQSHVDPDAALDSLTRAAGQIMEPSAEGRMALALAYELAGRQLYPDALATLESVVSRVAPVDADLAQRLELYALSLGLEESFFSVRVETRITRLLGRQMTSAQNERFLNALLAYRGGMLGSCARETRRRVQATMPARISRDLIDQWSFTHLVVALIALDDCELAAKQCDEALQGAEDLPMSAALVLGLKCLVSRRLGRLQDAESAGLAAIERLDALGVTQDGSVVVALSGLIATWVDAGNLNLAAEVLRDRELAGDLPEFSAYHAILLHRGRLRAALGEHEAALRDFLECGSRMERRGARNPATNPWRSNAALAHLALGDRSRAQLLVGQELELARDWNRPTAVGVALRVAGMVAGGDIGTELLGEAVTTLRGSTARLELARALVDWGVALREAGRGAEALAALRQGHELAKRCGAIPLMGTAARELRVSGGRPSRTTTADPNALTEQEAHIAQRALLGLTNRQIAEELFVTPRAVELHLTRAYRKLGISGRRDLAAALQRTG